MKGKVSIITLLTVLCLASINLYASFYPEKPSAWVNDYAGTLSPAEEQSLNQKLFHFQDTTGTQIFIVTTNDHEGAPISLMAAEIGQKWGVGKRSEDNGILILIYPNDREVFIATGYGIEPYITDAASKRIIENEIIPAFRENDFHGGLDKATDVMINLLTGVFTADQYSNSNEVGAGIMALFMFVIFAVILFAQLKQKKSYTLGKGIPFWLALTMLGGTRNSHTGSFGNFRSGGGSFGGFSGGGGGRFGGGGAGGRW